MRTGLVFMTLLTVVAIGQTASAGGIFDAFRGERGSGVYATEQRDAKGFDRVKVNGSTDVLIEIGDKVAVEVTADDNLLDNVITRVHGRTLEIRTRGSYRDAEIEVHITVPHLTAVAISGSGDVEVRDVKEDFFEIEISGSGDIDISGEVDEVDISVEGSGDVNARRLKAREARARVDGSGDIDVFAREFCRGTVNGSGDIDIYGDPKISRRVHGSGDISRR
ncbi:MAG: DUF2807 domain-containing protein [candidate division Zixibacteria bacterium]|nr:DUF2807 domain-containing protein [candidate division Zixibacteria bacterium]